MELPRIGGGSLKSAETESPAVASVVAVGDELLLGRTVDTNGAWLSSQLASLGMPVGARSTVGDRAKDIQEAVRRLLGDHDVVLVSGGLGPTHDDLTLDAVAQLFERPVTENPELRRSLEDRFRARGFDPMPPSNLKMARVPQGAVILPNPIGTAPGLALEVGGRSVILLPGVPRELKRIFEDRVEPYLVERFERRMRRVAQREIHTTGIPESELARRVQHLLDQLPDAVSLAFLPAVSGVTLRLTVRGQTEVQARELIEAADRMLSPHVDDVRFHAESGDLAEAVATSLLRTRTTIATAESCTGGLVAKRLTDRAGSSAFFLGGVVSYSNESKTRDLGVDADLLESTGAVSEPVAEAMARGVCGRFGSEAGIGVTGIAGPDGGTEQKPVGTVCYAVQLKQNIISKSVCFNGDREIVRARSAQAALALLLRMIEAVE